MVYSTTAGAEIFLSGLQEKIYSLLLPHLPSLILVVHSIPNALSCVSNSDSLEQKGVKKPSFFILHHSHVCFGVLDSFSPFWSSLEYSVPSHFVSQFPCTGRVHWMTIPPCRASPNPLHSLWGCSRESRMKPRKEWCNSSGVMRSYFSLEEAFLWGLISF